MKTPSSSRIIPGERIAHAVPFQLGALPPAHAGAAALPGRARVGGAHEAAEPLRQAFESGYRRGVAAGEARAAQSARTRDAALGASLAQRVDALLGAAEHELAAFQAHAAEHLVSLAIELARQVLRTTIAADAAAIVPVVQEVLAAEIATDLPATLALNPADVEAVHDALGPVLARRRIELQPDPTITIGGCRWSCAQGSVDATLEERWSRVMAAIGRPDEPLAAK